MRINEFLNIDAVELLRGKVLQIEVIDEHLPTNLLVFHIETLILDDSTFCARIDTFDIVEGSTDINNFYSINLCYKNQLNPSIKSISIKELNVDNGLLVSYCKFLTHFYENYDIFTDLRN